MDNPCTSWLADSSWDNITELDKLPNFHGIMVSFEQYPRDWNLWFTSAEPENATLPGLFMLVEVCYWTKFFPPGTIKLKCTLWVCWCVRKAVCPCCCALTGFSFVYDISTFTYFPYLKKLYPSVCVCSTFYPSDNDYVFSFAISDN